MRKSPQETLQDLQQLLRKLKADWKGLDRPQTNSNLRNSLYTRIVETEAHIRRLQTKQGRRQTA